MKLVIANTSALDHLRWSRMGRAGLTFPTRACSLADAAYTWEQISQFDMPWFPRVDARLHVLASKRERRRKTEKHQVHLWSTAIPSGSLCSLGGGVFSCSPEMVFVQMANELPFNELVLLGFELCGTYTHKPAEERGFKQCAQATRARSIARFAASCGRARGAHIALRAARFVCDGSASPMESRLTMLLCLPPRLGGFGLPWPDLNPPTELSGRQAQALGKSELRCDLHWLGKRIACEYSSAEFHRGRWSEDAERANVLHQRGETVFFATPSIVLDAGRLEALARQLAHALGKRLAPNALRPSKERELLRNALLT